jgi:hypothetical protein
LAQKSRQPARWDRRTALPHMGQINMNALLLMLLVLTGMAFYIL